VKPFWRILARPMKSGQPSRSKPPLMNTDLADDIALAKHAIFLFTTCVGFLGDY
jgi:hypothetical protein